MTPPHLDGILRFEKLRRYALYFEVHLPGGFRLMYAFAFPGGLGFGVEFSDIWLSEGGLGSLFGPFWMPWASLGAPGTSSVAFCGKSAPK